MVNHESNNDKVIYIGDLDYSDNKEGGGENDDHDDDDDYYSAYYGKIIRIILMMISIGMMFTLILLVMVMMMVKNIAILRMTMIFVSGDVDDDEDDAGDKSDFGYHDDRVDSEMVIK